MIKRFYVSTMTWQLSPIGMPKKKQKKQEMNQKKTQKQNLETSLSRLKSYMVSCFVQI
jgi:hypothetical protein